MRFNAQAVKHMQMHAQYAARSNAPCKGRITKQSSLDAYPALANGVPANSNPPGSEGSLQPVL